MYIKKERNFVQEILENLSTKRGDKINKVMSTIHLPVERRPEYRQLPTHRVCQLILRHKKKQRNKTAAMKPKNYFILMMYLIMATLISRWLTRCRLTLLIKGTQKSI